MVLRSVDSVTILGKELTQLPGHPGISMSELIISVSGLRGVVGDSLTPEVAIRFVNAFCQKLPPGRSWSRVMVAIPGRWWPPRCSRRCWPRVATVSTRGVAATPTTGVLVQHLAAAGGIQISASHNPPEYNGLKLFDAMGRVIPSTRWPTSSGSLPIRPAPLANIRSTWRGQLHRRHDQCPFGMGTGDLRCRANPRL